MTLVDAGYLQRYMGVFLRIVPGENTLKGQHWSSFMTKILYLRINLNK